MHTSSLKLGGLSAGCLLAGCLLWALPAVADESQPTPGWKRQAVNLRAAGGLQVRAVYAPPGKPVPFRGKYHRPVPAELQPQGATANGLHVGVINSPSIAGFIPWIAATATNAHNNDEYAAAPESSMVGSPLVPDPSVGYCVGLYDTGASTSVIGYASANQLGIYAAGYTTGNTVAVTGVTGSVDCATSKPMGLFIDGLQTIDPSTLILDTSGMMGASNFSSLVAPEPDPGMPDLFTAIGAPLAAMLHTVVRNDQPITRVVNGQTYTAPTIHVYNDASDPGIPEYPNSLLLSFLPAGAASVSYFPCILPEFFGCPDEDKPMYPSLVGGESLLQALFFLNESNGLDLADGIYNRTFYKFIVDTGSQLTVIGSSVVSRLHLPTGSPEFQVEVQGVDGQIMYRPGFYLDLVDIPVLSPTGESLAFTQVPVVYLDVASPECTTCKLDGILGMNLLEKYNFVVHGGLYEGEPPSITFERVAIFGDLDGDYDVDADDLAALQACFSGPGVLSAGQGCDAFDADGDGDVDVADFGAFQACFSGTDVAANPGCHPVP